MVSAGKIFLLYLYIIAKMCRSKLDFFKEKKPFMSCRLLFDYGTYLVHFVTPIFRILLGGGLEVLLGRCSFSIGDKSS
jgi:hypothetical protein